MTIFKKGINTKTGQTVIACIEEKTVFMATVEGKIYKQFPRQHLKEECFTENVEFPVDYMKARMDFITREEDKRREREEAKRLAAEEKRKRWAEERRMEVMTVRKVRSLAFANDSVKVYKVFADDMELGSDGEWYPCNSSYSSDTMKTFFDETGAKDYYEQLIAVKVDGKTPVEVNWMEAEIESSDILDVTGYEALQELIEDAGFEFKETSMAWPEYKSVEGGVIVSWSWEPYVGYARRFRELRIGGCGETEEDLLTGNEDRTIRPNLTLVLGKEELEGLNEDELRETLEDALLGDWKWRNPAAVSNAIEELIEQMK